MTSFRIVSAHPRYADALTALMYDSAVYQGRYASILDGYRLTPEYIDQHPTFLAETDEGIAGFYALILEPPELDLLFVTDAMQEKGVGAGLVTHMLKQAGAREITAVRVISNPPAAGFYQRMGARQVGVVPPSPPKITWQRPEFVFDVAARR